MEIIVLTTVSEEKSARKLGYPTYTYLPYEKKNHDELVVIRWGNGFVSAPILNPIFDEQDDFKYVLNPQKSIELNVTKNKSFEILSATVPMPKIYKLKIPSRKTAVYRPTQHAGGSNFKLQKGPFIIEPNHYATEFIRTNREIRVFVCGNKSLTCSREKGKKSDSDICRSNYAYLNFRKTPKRLHGLAIRAAKALKLDICAFDILVKGRKYYFLEGNSAPTIEGEVRQFFQAGIKTLIKLKFPKIGKISKSQKTVNKPYGAVNSVNLSIKNDNKTNIGKLALPSWATIGN